MPTSSVRQQDIKSTIEDGGDVLVVVGAIGPAAATDGGRPGDKDDLASAPPAADKCPGHCHSITPGATSDSIDAHCPHATVRGTSRTQGRRSIGVLPAHSFLVRVCFTRPEQSSGVHRSQSDYAVNSFSFRHHNDARRFTKPISQF